MKQTYCEIDAAGFATGVRTADVSEQRTPTPTHKRNTRPPAFYAMPPDYSGIELGPRPTSPDPAVVGPIAAALATTAPAPSALETQVGGDHYRTMKVQPAEFIMGNGIPWAEGSVVQYVARWRDKGGVQDLRKARHLLDMLIEHETRGAKP